MLTNEIKAKRGKSLALFAAVAMIVCAFALIVPAGGSDADVPTVTPDSETPSLGTDLKAVADTYYYVNTQNTTALELTDDAAGKNYYFILGASGSITLPATVNGGVHIYALSSYVNDKASYYGELEVSGVGNGVYSGAEDGGIVSATGPSVYGLAETIGAKTTYYAPNVRTDVKLTATGDKVVIVDGAVSVSGVNGTTITNTVKVTVDSAVDDKGVKTIDPSKYVTVSAVATDGETEYVGALSAEETGAAGSIQVTKGSVAYTKDALDIVSGVSDATRLYAGISDKFPGVVTTVNEAITIYGSISKDLTLVSGGTVNLAENGTYSGTLTYKGNAPQEEEIPPFTYTFAVRITATGEMNNLIACTDSGLAVNGSSVKTSGADVYAISSNVIVESVTSTGVPAGYAGTLLRLPELTDIQFGQNFSLEARIGLRGDCVVPADSTISLDGGMIMINNASSTLAVLGGIIAKGDYARTIDNITATVYAANVNLVKACVTIADNVKPTTAVISVATEDDGDIFVNAVTQGLNVELSIPVLILDDVEVNGGKIQILNGGSITVGLADADEYKTVRDGGIDAIKNLYPGYIIVGEKAFGSLVLNNCTIDNDNTDATGITVGYLSELEINESAVYTVVDAPESSVKANNTSVTYEGSTDKFKVGYATELLFSKNTVGEVEVYGKLIVKSDATISKEITVHSGGQLIVNEDVTVRITGAADFLGGSKTTVNGSMILGDKNGGAIMTVGDKEVMDDVGTTVETPALGAEFLISKTGTLTMVRSTNGITNNTLNVYGCNTYVSDVKNEESWGPRFLVEGTAVLVGEVNADAIHDNGVVDFNASGDATIVLYNGITLEHVKSTGTLRVTDKNVAMAERYANGAKGETDGNVVIFENATGITLTEDVKLVTWKNTADNKTESGYQSVMTVSGTLSYASDSGVGKMTVTGNGIEAVSEYSKSTKAYVSVADTLIVNGNASLSNEGEIRVSGEVVITAAATVNGSTVNSAITNAGTITVTGEMTVREGHFATEGTINAVKRTVTVSSKEANYTDMIYSGFSVAVDNGLAADDKEITVLGSVTASESKDIPEGLTVVVEGTLSVGKDADIIFKSGSALDGKGTVTVKGLMTVEDTDNLSLRDINADVVIENEPSKSWTSLARSLAVAEEGSTIILGQNVTITENTIIPAGVTVSTGDVKYDGTTPVITVDGCTLTIEGTLQMEKNAQGQIAIEDGKVIAGAQGVFAAAGVTEEPADVGSISGAHFAMVANGTMTYYVTNLAYAAEATAGKIIEDSKITVLGSVVSSDVTFKGGNEGLTIEVRSISDTDEGMTILNAGIITLDNATLQIQDNDKYVRVSAIVQASVDGTDSVVRIVSANGMTVSNVIDGADEYLMLTGNINGDVFVTAGIVTVSDTLTVPDGRMFTVENGATLVVPERTTFVNNAMEETTVIDGTIRVAGTISGDGTVVVNGDMNVDQISLGSKVRVTGNVTVTDGKVLTITGMLVLGAKPATLGVSSAVLAGDIELSSNGKILAYAGADISGAKINWNSVLGENGIDSITYFINGGEYATLVTIQNSNVQVAGIQDVDGAIDLRKGGFMPVQNWYASAQAANNGDDKIDTELIGKYGEAYAVVGPCPIEGKFSLGAGMVLYIDDVVYTSEPSSTVDNDTIFLTVGTHTIRVVAKANYSIDDVVITFNGKTVKNGGTITIEPEMDPYLLKVDGAIQQLPNNNTGDNTSVGGGDGLSVTDILLIVLVVLIAIMAVVITLRMMRS